MPRPLNVPNRRLTAARSDRRARLLSSILLMMLLASISAGAAMQPHEEAPAAQAGADVHEGAVAEGHTAEGQHDEGVWPTIARLANFAILVGTLVYLLRSPIASYLTNRSQEVRQDLAAAVDMRDAATRQMEEIDRRLAALPGELEGLRTRGAQEIADEETRINQAAARERQRLLDQMRREIEMQLRLARRELTREAATLAVQVARTRIESSMTPEDQRRLFDRYLEQVRRPVGSGPGRPA